MRDSQDLTPICSHPSLWIEEVVIYDDIEQKSVIRRISLKRGMNIVWGDSGEVPEDEALPGTLSGHSVGKSTFCRLIRYLLGEINYGRKGLCSGVMYALPKAAVGAIIHVGDTPWAVMRQIGVSNKSRAAVGMSLDELLTEKQKDCPYTDFLTALNEVFMRTLPGYPDQSTEKRYRWEHLLAWMTRDQETRYQSLWDWRSPRSESNVASLKKSEAMTLMRMVLDLYSTKEENLTQQIERQKAEYKAASDRIIEQQRDLQSKLQHELDAFKEILTAAGVVKPDDGGLFGYDVQADFYRSELEKQLTDLYRTRERLAEQIAALREERQKYLIVLRRLVAGIQNIEETHSTDESIAGELQEIEAAANIKCVYGDRKFAECGYYLENVQRLRKEYAEYLRRKRKRDGTDTGHAAALQDWTAKHIGYQRDINRLTKEIDRYATQLRSTEQQIANKQAVIQRIKYHLGVYEHLRDLGRNEEAAAAIHAARDLAGELRDLETRLKTVRGKLDEKRAGIETLFKDTITRMLTARYSGEVNINRDGEIDFTIGEGSGLSGEAVETLSLVIADVTAMRWAIEQTGYHPRFLIHDSPREADLDRGIYNSYLMTMRTLAAEYDGEVAPFQYIVTTTSRPPKRLVEDGTVVLRLQSLPAEMMLLGRAITYSPGLYPEE